MKKSAAVTLSVVLAILFFVGCRSREMQTPQSEAQPTTASTTAVQTTESTSTTDAATTTAAVTTSSAEETITAATTPTAHTTVQTTTATKKPTTTQKTATGTTAAPQYDTITLHQKTTYHGVEGYFTLDEFNIKEDPNRLIAMGLAPEGTTSVNKCPSEYHDVENDCIVWFVFYGVTPAKLMYYVDYGHGRNTVDVKTQEARATQAAMTTATTSQEDVKTNPVTGGEYIYHSWEIDTETGEKIEGTDEYLDAQHRVYDINGNYLYDLNNWIDFYYIDSDGNVYAGYGNVLYNNND